MILRLPRPVRRRKLPIDSLPPNLPEDDIPQEHFSGAQRVRRPKRLAERLPVDQPKAAHYGARASRSQDDVGHALKRRGSRDFCAHRYEGQRLGPMEDLQQSAQYHLQQPLGLQGLLACPIQGPTASPTPEAYNLEGWCSEDGGCNATFAERASAQAGSTVQRIVHSVRWPAAPCPTLSSAPTSQSSSMSCSFTSSEEACLSSPLVFCSESTVASMEQSLPSTSQRRCLALPKIIHLHQLADDFGSPSLVRGASPSKPRALRHSPRRPRCHTPPGEPSSIVKTDLDCCGRRLSVTVITSPPLIS
mmetsp:Transcript_68834/g.113927  ORF Transcript_68834/g.113927 Transcript_68834/m.113927 type:complete len:304 (-) Transcript_68834:15-926(-)